MGCYVDREYDGDMLLKIKESGVMTFDDCNSQCSMKSFPFMGLRYNLQTQLQECWCGFHYGSFGSLVLDACNYFCAVSPQYRCGTNLAQYQSQKILSVYSTILSTSGNTGNTPISIIMSRNHIFEGNWKDSLGGIHQICQWNNDYIIEPTNTMHPNKISTINMLHILKLHQCGNNDAEYEELSATLHQLTWKQNPTDWTRQTNQTRYILPSFLPYTTYASPIISAQAITSDDFKLC